MRRTPNLSVSGLQRDFRDEGYEALGFQEGTTDCSIDELKCPSGWAWGGYLQTHPPVYPL
ncbi:hypothetical protein LINPERHAP1_LOCUS33835 [Linum perenne]